MKHVPSPRTAVRCVLCLVALAAGGCGSNTKPHGKLEMNGKPYKPASGEILQINFVGEGSSSVSAAAEVNPDGEFTVPGPTNSGIPAGKYHITVTTIGGGTPAGTSGGAAAPAGGDKFQGKYNDATKTPLTCEITSANQPIVIDLGKGTVTTGG